MTLKICVKDGRAPLESKQEDEDADPGKDDDSSAFRARSESGGPFTALRSATRCFAMECVCRIIAQCETADPAHFDMALAQERRLHDSTGKTSQGFARFMFLDVLDLVDLSPVSLRFPGPPSWRPGTHGVYGINRSQ